MSVTRCELIELVKPTRTFSSTVICEKSRMFWKVRAMPILLTCTTLLPAVS